MSLLGKLTALIALLGLCWSATSFAAHQPEDEFREDITNAVNRGVAFLRKSQAQDGTWRHDGPRGDKEIGTTAFCGLALLESGEDIDDPALQKAAATVRSRAMELTDTQAIAMALYFLDRSSRGREDATVILLGKKLLQGQHPSGGWGGHCPLLAGETEDNYHTLFAVLGLWIARRNGLNADDALQRAEKRFRDNQQPGSGWGYQFGAGKDTNPTPAMTCAGMMSLAFGFATRYKPREDAADTEPKQRPQPNLKEDAQVVAGRDFIAKHLTQPFQPGRYSFLFFWSVERVSMVYGYAHYNGIDWYHWGARNLLKLQQPNGSWEGDAETGPNGGTALALLTLRKSHLLGQIYDFPKDLVGPLREGTPGEALAFQKELRTGVSAERFREVLALLQNTRGSEYTHALVESIPAVRPELQDKVRLALQQRLHHRSTDTLGAYLGSEGKELRLACLKAVLHLAADKETLVSYGLVDLAPHIIFLLNDREPQIAAAALETLKKLSGKDFGRDPAAWQKWWADRRK
jgi:hypothetical protein